ncbi:hypothetical protein CXG81DRAFT_6080, partial [Caulochytrium protostelioides]
VVLLTGCTRGIGAGILKQLLSHEHVHVVGVSRSATCEPPTPGAAARFTYVAADLAQGATAARAAVDAAVKTHNGQLDAVIHNAGVLEPLSRVATVDAVQWERAMTINTMSVLHLLQATLPALRTSRGTFVYNSSGAAAHGYAGWGAYCTSKAAANMIIECAAAEEDAVTLLSVRPGVVRTDMQTVIRETAAGAMKPEEYAKFTAFHENDQLLSPEVPAAVFANVALAPSDAIHGLSGKFISFNAAELSAYQ